MCIWPLHPSSGTETSRILFDFSAVFHPGPSVTAEGF